MVQGQNAHRTTDLVAILLLTRSRPGQRLVFHYPPQPHIEDSKRSHASTSDNDSDDESEADEPPAKLQSSRSAVTFEAGPTVVAAPDSRHPEDSRSDETVLGFSRNALEKLLSPGRWCDRKKFELCLDGLVFIGRPIFADQDGRWRKDTVGEHRKPVVEPEKVPSSNSDGEELEEETSKAADAVDITITAPQTPGIPAGKFDHVPDSFEDRAATSLATSMQSNSTQSVNVAEQLTMFHVVFVARESGQHYGTDLYQHLAKKLSKALHYCQKQTGYVATESRKTSAVRTKSQADKVNTVELWASMCDSSELAWALKEIYEKISQGQIAGFRLSGMEMSLQIPDSEDFDPFEPSLSAHAAILLLEDKISLLRTLTHPDASPLASFIRGHTATKSLEKNARNIGMPLANVMYIARHLVKWRKARIIAPLHARNIYILAPSAPLNQMSHYVGDYARRFAALPTLPHMLNSLSARPIKYGSLIPSRDHRTPYMDILAYLVQHRFVIQLKTFGWLHTPLGGHDGPLAAAVNQNRRPMSVAQLLSPQLNPRDDDTISVSSERTAIPLSLNEVGRVTSNDSTMKSLNESTGPEAEAAPRRLIRDPLDPSDEDAYALAIIKSVIRDDELSSRFESLLQYFDGEHALEEIAAQEGVKRSKIEFWLDLLQKSDVLETFRRL